MLTTMPLSISFALLAATAACAATQLDQPAELGSVRWTRDLDSALQQARASEKPVFALFQEVPGCSTCKSFGAGPLSHPLLVEAIEDLFVPLVVFNNKGGDDARALERYDEPSWNNPVVRYLDAEGEDVLARRDRVWSTGAVAARTAEALRAAGDDVPRWLTLVVDETNAGNAETTTFAMACFWQGEARLGLLDGVVATTAGWQDGREVVEVRYDPRRIDAERLAREAQLASCTAAPDDARPAKDSDRKYYLRRSPLRHLPLTPMQQTRVNAALGTGGDPTSWLSPRQVELFQRVTSVLKEDPRRLDGLEPPTSLDGPRTHGELHGYELRLRKQLGR